MGRDFFLLLYRFVSLPARRAVFYARVCGLLSRQTAELMSCDDLFRRLQVLAHEQVE